ncbi:MAG: MoaD/ThiS family protein [Gammaproteobacteria bacterium]|nr:MoaD/ThiS family protein [Gammaproteobacteria bacterium]
MQVSVKLFGALRQFLPAGSEFNACRLNIDDGARLTDVLQQLPIPDDKPYLVLLNDCKLDKNLYAETEISASDEIVLLPPIKGG